MPGAPRKTAPRKAQPQPAEPAVVAEEVDDDTFDLLTVIATEDLPPLPVTLRGVKAEIRRSYSGEECAQFTAYIRNNQVEEALKLIAGEDDGAALATAIGAFNIPHGIKLFNQIAKMSTLEVGEALALLPAYFQGMDGAQPSPDVNGTTAEASAKS